MEMSVIVNKHFVDIVLFKKKDKNSVILYEKKERDYEEEARVRAFRKCVEYGLNNDWQYFITITLDDKKVDSKNYDYVLRRLLKDFENVRRYYDKDFKYLLVPELSPKNNRLHFHGLIRFGKTIDELKKDGEIKYLGRNKKFKNRFYRYERFYKRYGASRLDEIVRDSPAIVYYIAAYLGKSNRKIDNRTIDKIGTRYYYSSKGLKKAAKITLNKQQEDNIIAGVRHMPATYSNEFLQKFRLTKKQFEQVAAGQHLVKYDMKTGEIFQTDAEQAAPYHPLLTPANATDKDTARTKD
jgi:hypothetical protein